MSAWRRTYWSVWIANLVTAVGMMSFLPFFPSLMEELGVSDRATVSLWSGICFGAAPLSATLMSPIWGSVGDRFGRKIMVVRALGGIALFVGCMAFATSPLQVLLLRIGQGMFSGFIPPSVTLVSIQAPAERQGRIAANLGTSLPIGAMIGPLVGGLIAASHGYRSVFLFVAGAATLATLLVLLGAREPEGATQARGDASIGSVLRGTVDDQRDVWGNRSLRSALGIVFLLQFGLGSTNPLIELHVRDLLAGERFEASLLASLAGWLPGQGRAGGGLALATSLIFTCMAVANLLAMPAWGVLGDRIGHGRALRLAGALTVLALVAQAVSHSYTGLFWARAFMGLSLAGAGALAFGLAAAEVAVDRRGGAMGAVFSARTLAVALGGTVGGLLEGVVGVRGVMWLAAGILALALPGRSAPKRAADIKEGGAR